MSLRVWLPLNGDIKNYGTDIIETEALVQSGFVNNGKIGKALNNTTSDNCGINLKTYMNTASTFTEYSMCAWIYMTSQATNHSSSIFSSGNWNTGAGQCSLALYSFSGGGYNKLIFPNKTQFNTFINLPEAITLNKWWHICVTYDGSTTKAYVNGNYIGSANLGGITATSETSNLFIGRATYYNGFTLKGYINDARIYDNCLTANEVKDISKALVLYYPLNQPSRNKNLVSGFNAGGHTSISGKSVIIQPQTSVTDTYFQINLNEVLVANTTYALSCKIKGMSCSADWYFPLFAQTNPLSKNLIIYHDKTFTSVTFSLPTGSTYVGGTSIFMDDTSRPSTNPTPITLYDFKLEKSPIATPWCPPVSDLPSRIDLIEYDCSGYNHNGAVTDSTSPTLADDSSRNSFCYQFDGTNQAVQIPFNNAIPTDGDGIFTMNTWAYHDSNWSSKTWETIFGGPSGFELEMKNSSTNSPVLYAYSWGKGNAIYELNKWNMITMVRTPSDTKFFINGELKFTGTAGTLPAGNYFIGSWRDTSSQNYRGKVSDFKIYATALSAADVAKEYRRFAAIYQDKTFYSSEIVEDPSLNLLAKSNAGIATKKWVGALSSFTQSNCQVSLTKDGYRIYRPANKNPSTDGNTMWGGFVLKPFNENSADMLVKGHTYILKWHVKGKSSNGSASSSGWSNNVGWGGGGLMPSPSNVSTKWTPSNFNGEMDCWYKWTINDDVYKVCTSSYSSFVQGNTYLSYRDFKFGFEYTDTGSLGTDLYITNIRLYDITANKKVNIGLNSVLNGELVEGNYDKISIFSDGEIYSREFINI